MKKFMAILLSVLMAFSVMAVTASAAGTDVAAIGGATYATLQEAINACAAGDTITLINNVTEDVTVKNDITIDGDNHQYVGQITLSETGATIQDVNFVNGRIYKTSSKSTGVLTVKNCNFDGAYNTKMYAIEARHAGKLVVENCTGKNTGYGFIYVPLAVVDVFIKDVVIEDVPYGIHIAYNNGSTIENAKIRNCYVGVMNQSNGAKTITFNNCDVEATYPVVVWEKAATTQTLKFDNDNRFVAPEGGNWIDGLNYTKFIAKCTVDTSSNEFGYAHTASEAVIENNVEPDCTNSGSYDSVVYCSECKCEISRETKTVKELGHTPGAEASCQAAQTCTVCGAELDAIKDHTYIEYISNNDATCQKDGTKTATCIYGCGTTDTVTDKGTMKEHNDSNGNGECDYCSGEFCSSCGRLHNDLISSFICLLIDFLKLATSFIKAVF